MSSFAPASKSSNDEAQKASSVTTYPIDIVKVPYKPDATVDDVICFKYYNEDEVIMGKPMKDWLRFSVCYWHTFRGTGADPFGFPTLKRSWDDGSDSIENAERRMRVAFDFMSKLGVKYWTFHDRDIAPEGATLDETNSNLDRLVELASELQDKTGIKLLWNTCNLFAHPRYSNGAATNADAHVVACAAAQVKKGLEVGKKLGAENFVFWGGREGYHTLLNTNVREELDSLANFFKMAVAYKKKIGFTGPFLIEPKPKEPTKHQYDYDAMTVIAFLKTYNLDKDFKLNIEPNHTTLAGHGHEHDVVMASSYGMLGSVDSNTGSPDLGWDTDQFPMDVKNATFIMKTILDQGGLAPGGLNFDCKVRRESSDVADMLISHIGAMDCFAKALRVAAKIKQDGVLDKMKQERYASFGSGLGAKLKSGNATFEDCHEYICQKGEPERRSGHQEKFETVLNRYLL
ncbi:xylose isomerase-like [Clavelina lepadiformis]|uniref:xylose isomerase-like n=1 Tax=Clavelina lepadiformis TaxID=159417 RepID=UPI004041AA82